MSAARVPSHRSDDSLLVAYGDDHSPADLERLVERYRPLARSLARRYLGGADPFEDLLQVADLGLVKAIRAYDPDRPNSFVAYAVPTILGELRRHLRDRVWNLRLPRALQESAMTIEGALDGLTEELGRDPSTSEIAERAGLSDDEVEATMVAREARWPMSMDAPVRPDDPTAPARVDLIGREEFGYDRVEADYACSTARLDEREREVLALRYGGDMTQAEVGSRLGISQMQVSRLSRRALGKLLAAVQGDEAAPRAA